MQSGEESLAWVSLTRAPALDAAAVSRALQLLGTAQHMVRASSAAYARAGLPAAAGEFLSGVHAAPTAAERAWLDDPHHHIVPFTDPHYPALLRTAQRPLVVAGGGVLYAEAEAALGRFCAAHGLPASETQAGKSCLPVSYNCVACIWDTPCDAGQCCDFLSEYII